MGAARAGLGGAVLIEPARRQNARGRALEVGIIERDGGAVGERGHVVDPRLAVPDHTQAEVHLHPVRVWDLPAEFLDVRCHSPPVTVAVATSRIPPGGTQASSATTALAPGLGSSARTLA